MPLQRAIDNIKTFITGPHELADTQDVIQKKTVSAGALILREVDGELKIALAQRKRKTRTWVIPKGHVEPGETIEQAALREIYEEAGLHDVQLIKYLGSLLRESVKSNGECV